MLSRTPLISTGASIIIKLEGEQKQIPRRKEIRMAVQMNVAPHRGYSADQVTKEGMTLADLLQNEGSITELLRSRLASTVFDEAPSLITLNSLTK